MISCKTIIHQPQHALDRFIKKDPHEGPVCFQLSSNNREDLAEATKRVTDYGADLIDLNCGCPVKKIRTKGAGSRLLTDTQTLYQLISAMKANTHLPVSIKIRVEGMSDEKSNLEVAKVVSEAGADFLIVHGRHWKENYETACRYDQIKFFVEQLNIPVIGNGDIACPASLMAMFATGCAGVMIARAGVGQPWLIGQLTAALKGDSFLLPEIKEVGALFLEHVEALALLLKNDKFALLQARTFAKYYARRLPDKTAFCEAMNTCTDLTTLKALVSGYFR